MDDFSVLKTIDYAVYDDGQCKTCVKIGGEEALELIENFFFGRVVSQKQTS